MSSLKAVLWDMDGTLVDTEVLWDKAIYGAMEDVGAPLTPEQRVLTIGMSMDNLLETLAGFAGGTSDDLTGIINDKIITSMGELYQTEMQWQPGAREIIQEIRAAGIPQALVTNTQRVLTDLALRKVGKENFAVSVCGDEVAAGKPAPEPYLRAAELLSLSPHDCLVVEDSMTGITSGRAAGCHVLGIRTENPLAPGEGYDIWESLAGVTLADLQRYVANSQPSCSE